MSAETEGGRGRRGIRTSAAGSEDVHRACRVESGIRRLSNVGTPARGIDRGRRTRGLPPDALPVAQRPIFLVILNMWVTSVASMSLSCERRGLVEERRRHARQRLGSVFAVASWALADWEKGRRARRGMGVPELSSASRRTRCPAPRTPMDVIPTDLIALNAYSVARGAGGGNVSTRGAEALVKPRDGRRSRAGKTAWHRIRSVLQRCRRNVAVVTSAASFRHLGGADCSTLDARSLRPRPAHFKPAPPRRCAFAL